MNLKLFLVFIFFIFVAFCYKLAPFITSYINNRVQQQAVVLQDKVNEKSESVVQNVADSLKTQLLGKIDKSKQQVQDNLPDVLSVVKDNSYKNVLEIKAPEMIRISNLQISNDKMNISYLLDPIQVTDGRVNKDGWKLNVSVSDLDSGSNVIGREYVKLSLKDKDQLASRGIIIKEGNPLQIKYSSQDKDADELKFALTPVMKITLPQGVRKGIYSGTVTSEID